MKVFGGTVGRQERPKGARVPVSDLQNAFRYAQGLPGVSVVVLGLHDATELEQSIEWARNYRPLDEAETLALLARGKELAREWGEVYGTIT
jgi:hypothetical protein